MTIGPIGIFDSGYGGLTVMREVVQHLPRYDYTYLGDNARTPYGTRSFDTVYRYTLECVTHLFGLGCPLVILACNTASAKALRTIQQRDLPGMAPGLRVLGVIRPTTEVIGSMSHSGHVGILGTAGTVASDSYPMEIARFFPHVHVFQEACPMWVPLVENGEHDGPGADFFVHKHIEGIMRQSSRIDTLLLACTHYPLLLPKIAGAVPAGVRIVTQGGIVAEGLRDYLKRHPEMEARCSKGGKRQFLTTDDPVAFGMKGSVFYGSALTAAHCDPGAISCP